MFENLTQIELIFAVFAVVAIISAVIIYFINHKNGRFFVGKRERKEKKLVNRRGQNSRAIA